MFPADVSTLSQLAATGTAETDPDRHSFNTRAHYTSEHGQYVPNARQLIDN